MSTATVTIDGKRFFVVPEMEYRRIRELARELPSVRLPKLPKPDAAGNVPALEFARTSFARKLIRDRRRVGLTRAELGQRARVAIHLLSRIESGKLTPDTATFNRIHRVLERVERKQTKSNGSR
ncbi:MAG TPA: helix-turn-helix domain-containing protein [Tepidisphaeraceae bacterium]|jgi:ribosome-binding protein aMBF1 (putative translation factor)|nr:helix-turn-helix domain-containing protein [Tepidisphaeraceae bacterium]